jgi:hypothetical protein
MWARISVLAGPSFVPEASSSLASNARGCLHPAAPRYREALRHQPDFAPAHGSLGTVRKSRKGLRCSVAVIAGIMEIGDIVGYWYPSGELRY